MARPLDPQRVIRNTVHVKAIHVKNHSECTRRYGSNKKSKILKGVVLEVFENNDNSQKTVTIMARYELGGGFENTATLSSRSVKVGPPPVDVAATQLSPETIVPTQASIIPLQATTPPTVTQPRLTMATENEENGGAHTAPLRNREPPNEAVEQLTMATENDENGGAPTTPLRNREPPNEAVERPILARSVVTPLVAGAVPPRAATGVPRTSPEDPFVPPILPRVVARAPYVEVHGQQWHAPRQDVLNLPVNSP